MEYNGQSEVQFEMYDPLAPQGVDSDGNTICGCCFC